MRVSLSLRPEWLYVTPVPQDDEPSPAVPMPYKEEYFLTVSSETMAAALFAIPHLGNHQQDKMLLKFLLVFSFLVLASVLNANDKLKKAEERNSLVRDISAAMEKAWDSFEKSHKNIQTIADDQAKIERTIRSLVEEIMAMRQLQLLQLAVAGGF